jgi:hypothetical protein
MLLPGRTHRSLTAIVTVPILTAAFTLVAFTVAPTAGASCSGSNYYGRATSGVGSNKGTGASVYTWQNWSVPDHPYGFSDEAVWAFYQANPYSTNALEVGFFSGYGKGNYGGGSNFTNGMNPYFTLGNGAEEYDDWGYYLSSGALIWDSATSDGTHSWAYVNNTSIASPINYGVAFPHWNFAQGETDATDIWMGGGTGDSMTLYYQSSSNNWYTWGSSNICYDSPYWATGSSYYFQNGGY